MAWSPDRGLSDIPTASCYCSCEDSSRRLHVARCGQRGAGSGPITNCYPHPTRPRPAADAPEPLVPVCQMLSWCRRCGSGGCRWLNRCRVCNAACSWVASRCDWARICALRTDIAAGTANSSPTCSAWSSNASWAWAYTFITSITPRGHAAAATGRYARRSCRRAARTAATADLRPAIRTASSGPARRP